MQRARLRGHAVTDIGTSVTAFKGGVELDMSTLWWSGGVDGDLEQFSGK